VAAMVCRASVLVSGRSIILHLLEFEWNSKLGLEGFRFLQRTLPSEDNIVPFEQVIELVRGRDDLEYYFKNK